MKGKIVKLFSINGSEYVAAETAIEAVAIYMLETGLAVEKLEENNEVLIGVTEDDEKTLGVDIAELTIDSTEKEWLQKGLSESLGNKKRAADMLGISTSTLYLKMKKHGLK